MTTLASHDDKKQKKLAVSPQENARQLSQSFGHQSCSGARTGDNNSFDDLALTVLRSQNQFYQLQ